MTPTTPTSTPLIPPPNSFIPLAQRRGRRNVSAPTKAHVDLKAVLGESSDEEDITVASRAEPVPKAPARPRRSLPDPLRTLTTLPAMPPRTTTSRQEASGLVHIVCQVQGVVSQSVRRDPEKRRTQNEEAQRGYRQRRTAKYEAVGLFRPRLLDGHADDMQYQSGFEQLRQLYDMRSLNDRMKIRKVKDIIACVERVIERKCESRSTTEAVD